jgi:tetratricopeptide (TPR) repeat protein
MSLLNTRNCRGARAFVLSLLLLPALRANSQGFQVKEDSLLHLLKGRYSSLSPQRIDVALEVIVRYLPDAPVADSLSNLMIKEVEMERDRVLMCRLYSRLAGNLFDYFNKPDYYERAKGYTDRCKELADEKGLSEYKVTALLLYARYYRNLSQPQKALEYNNQAIALASGLGSDSLLSIAHGGIASSWHALSNKISEFQSLLLQQDFAERSGISRLIQDSYFRLGFFYQGIKEYEKAKDEFSLCRQEAEKSHDLYEVFLALEGLARCYLAEKDQRLGLAFCDQAAKLADSLDRDDLRIRINLDVLNYYFNGTDPVSGFRYMDEHPRILAFVKSYGAEFQLFKLHAILNTARGNYDSALYYLHAAEPEEYSQRANYSEKYDFTMQMANVLGLIKRYHEQEKTLIRASSFADSLNDLEAKRDVALQLDSVYDTLGDYKKSKAYLFQYMTLRDSIGKLSKQDDLLNIEIENTAQRAEQQKIKEAERTRVRNNLEYIGITAAIATIFIVLVVFGVFRISPAVIRALGFFAFIFLFEFIILLLDNQIHDLTHGEPWKVLGVKIVIIAMLLPLHHWLEQRTTHYLTQKAHRLLRRESHGAA